MGGWVEDRFVSPAPRSSKLGWAGLPTNFREWAFCRDSTRAWKVVQLYGLPGTGRSGTDVGPRFLSGPDRSAEFQGPKGRAFYSRSAVSQRRGSSVQQRDALGDPKTPLNLPGVSRDQFSAGMTSSTRCSNDVLPSLSLAPGSWGRMTRRFIPQFFLY